MGDGGSKKRPEVVVYDPVRPKATFICVECRLPFQREVSFEKHYRKQGKAGPFCGHSCAGKWHMRTREKNPRNY